MFKKTINILEILLLTTVCITLAQFYYSTNSTARYFETAQDSLIRIILDTLVYISLLIRVITLALELFNIIHIKTLKRYLLPISFGLYLVGISFDLYGWSLWYYYANMYLWLIVLFLSPILVWAARLIRK